jgi:DNA recombination protein RmuC
MRGGLLYDKFVNFVEDMERIGQRIKQVSDSYSDARTKLDTGRGNLVSQAEKLRALGVSPKKSLAIEVVEAALESAQELPRAGNGHGRNGSGLRLLITVRTSK